MRRMRTLLFPMLVAGTLVSVSGSIIGCSATHNVTMSVQEPAPVDIPPYVETVGVINRTLTEGDSGVLETIDRIFSVKGAKLDSMGAASGVNGMLNELSKNGRYEVRYIPGVEPLGNPSYGVFPAPLDWTSVDELCREHGVDALFSLEFYDTDTRIHYDTRSVTIDGPLDVKIPALEHLAEVETDIHTGWRIYDNAGRNLLDEYTTGETVVTSGRGINPAEAAKAVTGRTEAVQSISRDLGRGYAQSILPYWTRVIREYYVRGNDRFKTAKRRAQTGNWDGAAEIWLAETRNPDPKIAGRAHYNMAIIEEIRGNLDQAIGWAREAYEDYGDKLALRYLRTLQDRQARAEILRRQQE